MINKATGCMAVSQQDYNSGFVEGLNNKLKLLKRRCFGLDDPTELFRRLWLDIEGSTPLGMNSIPLHLVPTTGKLIEPEGVRGMT